MPEYLPIVIPPGFRNHGPAMECRDRWRLGNLVRWEGGSLRAIGGWRPLQKESGGMTDDVLVPAGIAREAHAWVANNGAPYLAVATDDNLYGAGVDLTFADITPVGFVPGVAGENLGYGGKTYGRNPYGTGRISDGVTAPASVWTLDNWGEQLLACTSGDNTLYVWDLIASAAAEITAAPPMDYFVVTAERFVMALGADNNPRKVAWCDRENYNDWTPVPTNEAGDIELVTQGALQGGCRVRGRTLLLTSQDAHVATYQGPPVVYGFQRVKRACGLAAPRTLVSAGQGAFWMGSEAFFMYDGSQVTEVPCEVLDYVFLNLNRNEIRKAWGVANERTNEVWWFYPSDTSTECDRYVAYDYEENHWLIGTLDRSAGTDAGAYTDPLWIASTREIYRHETGYSHQGEQPWSQTGPVLLGNGDNIMHATQMIQDELQPEAITKADIELEVETKYVPDGPSFVWGPYMLEPYTDMRFTGRQARFKLTAEDGAPWRLGGIRLEYETGGRR